MDDFVKKWLKKVNFSHKIEYFNGKPLIQIKNYFRIKILGYVFLC